MVIREIIPVYSQKDILKKNTFLGQNVELLDLKQDIILNFPDAVRFRSFFFLQLRTNGFNNSKIFPGGEKNLDC